MKPEKKKPERRMILRVNIAFVIPRDDGTTNVDVIETENIIGVTSETLPSKMMKKIKPQLIDTRNKAQEHTPSKIIAPVKSSLIMPGE